MLIIAEHTVPHITNITSLSIVCLMHILQNMQLHNPSKPLSWPPSQT